MLGGWRLGLGYGQGPRLAGGRTLASAHDLIQLLLIESHELRDLATGVLAVDLDHGGNEELLLLVSLGLPEVRLPQDNDESRFGGPFSLIPRNTWPSERLETAQVVQVPRLADGEGAVGVFLGLVDSNTAGFADGDNYDARLLRARDTGIRWRGRGGIGGEFGDSDMGDVGFLDCRAKLSASADPERLGWAGVLSQLVEQVRGAVGTYVSHRDLAC